LWKFFLLFFSLCSSDGFEGKFFNNSGIILKSLRNYCKVETFFPTFLILHKFQVGLRSGARTPKGWKIKFMIANLSENARLESIRERNFEHKFVFALHKPIKYLFMQNEVEFLQSSHTHRKSEREAQMTKCKCEVHNYRKFNPSTEPFRVCVIQK
jgi:hypothetical protein